MFNCSTQKFITGNFLRSPSCHLIVRSQQWTLNNFLGKLLKLNNKYTTYNVESCLLDFNFSLSIPPRNFFFFCFWLISQQTCIESVDTWIDRSSHWRYSVKKGVLKNFAKFTGKNLCQSLLFNKVAGVSL